ncbi:hypothetical protein KVR01_000972 [Diaporthe batatas]|uniref:uncharacterized protein n=1 Tax=Diaporthe batatas TaxID=748121 RepID=UPI001D04601A|nr:uncharacterized protein KVR01_000972 [Diaporthe batatas]KAG8170227.1 hypothetical protein KVR01_000972 [Diaporthe batatas]
MVAHAVERRSPHSLSTHFTCLHLGKSPQPPRWLVALVPVAVHCSFVRDSPFLKIVWRIMRNTRSNRQWDDIVEVQGPAYWLDVSRHDQFNRVPCGGEAARGDREATQETTPESKMVLKFSTPPHNGTPWFWFGQSDGPDTDVLISSSIAVSRCHIQLGFDDWGQVVIKDVSRFGTEITYTQLRTINGADAKLSPQIHEITGDKINPSVWVVPVGWKVLIKLGRVGLQISLQVPDHSDHMQKYQEKVREFKAEQNNPMPFLGGLALDSREITTGGLLPTVNRHTHDSRKGRYAWIIGDRKLGRGTFGQVFEVFNSSNWARCAGKRLEQGDELEREHSLMSKLDHKHIARYIDVHYINGFTPMIIMEYCGLGSLDKQQKDSRFVQDEVIAIITQIASAIAYLHSNSVTHRDLKPANILIRSREPLEIAVSDFGVSKQGESAMATVIGTHYYMAPEVLARLFDDDDHKTKYNNKSDIWSLGIVAVELINGMLPTLGVTTWEILDLSYARAMAESCDKLLASCGNKDFARLVREMLSWDPNARPTAAECFKRASSLVSKGAKGKSPAQRSESGHVDASVMRLNNLKRQPSDLSTAAEPPAKKAKASQASGQSASNPGTVFPTPLARELDKNESYRPSAAAGGGDSRSKGGF